MQTLAPRDEQDLRELIGDALIAQTPLAITGFQTRQGFGRPVVAEAALSMRQLAGVVFYEPQELVLCARAGTPVAEIADLLANHGQTLAFEPIDHSRFYGGEASSGSIGGLAAVNACGPRRIKVGAARDHLLGFRGVTGRGDLIKSGGRVMKNVTGYDLCKIVAGSHGTLVVLSEVTFKVLPTPETEKTVLLKTEAEAQGLALLRRASGLPVDISGFALIPGADGVGRAALRLEGTPASVACRLEDLAKELRGDRFTIEEVLAEDESRCLWRDVRDARVVSAAPGDVWRISTAPKRGVEVIESARAAGLRLTAHLYDWAGGLVWLAIDGEARVSASILRAAVDRGGGHVTLMRANEATRAEIPVFHPQAPALAALSARIKESFDPLRLLNRGRLRPDL